jgi:hypothetical protein
MMRKTIIAALVLSTACGGRAGQDDRPRREPMAAVDGHFTAPAAPFAGAGRGRRPAEFLITTPPEDMIAAIIDSTRVANVTATIERLQAYGTRYVVSDSCRAAAMWIRDRVAALGYEDVRLDTFRTWTWQDSVEAVNVIATRPGCTRPSEYVVLGGHYDSVTTQDFDDPDAPAPGAEDNATGVAGVLEAARVLADVETERGLIFAFWSAEEEGLWGSRDFVRRAFTAGTDIVAYLNLDAIGYRAGPGPDGYVIADSSAVAVAAWMCDVMGGHTPYDFEPVVGSMGASDHLSFWEAGCRAVDSQVDPTSPFMHTPEDVLANTDPAFATAIAAVNAVAAASIAGIVGTDANLPPETTLADNCAATHGVLTRSPTFAWDGVDFDGSVTSYEYALERCGPSGRDRPGEASGAPSSVGGHVWVHSRPGDASVTFEGLEPGPYVFRVRAIDEKGLADPSPAEHAFVASDTLLPALSVRTNYVPDAFLFRGPTPAAAPAARVFEGERLVFTVEADASAYCGSAPDIALAVNDTAQWGPWESSPYEFVLQPEAADTAIFVKTRDADGALTLGRIGIAPVADPRDRDLLHVDCWVDGSVPEAEHDAFYELALSEYDHDTWKPLEHVSDGLPTLPSMEEMGRYRTIFWTLDRSGWLLREAQAVQGYHPLEGYVRAGGNLVIEGPSALTSLSGGDPLSYQFGYGPGDFIHDEVGVDSLLNAGSSTNTAYPSTYGYAFLGGIGVQGDAFVDVPVDTLGKWREGYELFGGLPFCEVVRPLNTTRRLYIFHSFLNPALAERPCATLTRPRDGTGSVAYFGFPFYYLATSPASSMVAAVLTAIEEWQEPSTLVYFDPSPDDDRVAFEWYLAPADGPIGCDLERADGHCGGGAQYERVNDALIRPGSGGRYTFADTTVTASTAYCYRLVVVERWGGTTLQGPWDVSTAAPSPRDHLAAPWPNPAPAGVDIRYGVGADNRWVTVSVHDVAGRLVRMLREGSADAGEYSVPWDGTDATGRRVASGVYFVRVRIGPTAFHRKIVVLR